MVSADDARARAMIFTELGFGMTISGLIDFTASGDDGEVCRFVLVLLVLSAAYNSVLQLISR